MNFEQPSQQDLAELTRILDAMDHRSAGETIKATCKALNRISRKLIAQSGGSKPLDPAVDCIVQAADQLTNVRLLLDDAWRWSAGKDCGETHSPYYGQNQCSRCGVYDINEARKRGL